MDDEEIRALIRRYTAAWSSSDLDGWLSTFAPGATQEDPVGDGVRHGRDEIAAFWHQAMASYDNIEIRERAIHVVQDEAALEWTIVAQDGNEWVVFSGVDTFVFDEGPLITSVRAFWDRTARERTAHRP